MYVKGVLRAFPDNTKIKKRNLRIAAWEASRPESRRVLTTKKQQKRKRKTTNTK